ncbi:MAG: spermidine synthase, partial [Candidatus Omnitrophica bacterium]|nr:spermidine synthase [Candidatus Omnitrophota bacterium]
VFMAGIAVGSAAGGNFIARIRPARQSISILLYGIAEIGIGISAFVVPVLFKYGERWLGGAGEIDSLMFQALSAIILVVSIFPWCFMMGCTIPLMMAFVRDKAKEERQSFSYLYCANVIGAMLGTLLSSFILIELLGFSSTLRSAAMLNWVIGGISIVLFVSYKHSAPETKKAPLSKPVPDAVLLRPALPQPVWFYIVLFVIGFTSMAMEIAWVRAFMPVLRTRTYSFAGLLSVYFCATWLGTLTYRILLKKQVNVPPAYILVFLCGSSLLPIIVTDPFFQTGSWGALVSIIPFCIALGLVSPRLVDDFSEGDPAQAGQAYAVNVIGCILGPLCASYCLIPLFGVKLTIIIMAALIGLTAIGWGLARGYSLRRMAVLSLSNLILFCYCGFVAMDFEEMYAAVKGAVVKRDHVATVIAFGEGMDKRLLVNGVGITSLTDITKIMAHLPLTLLDHQPRSALNICFGMGTTYRSLLSWDIQVVSIELVPSVKDVFGYFFTDADEMLAHPKGEVLIDDGRRYLMRTQQVFDVITVDPPPPPEAAWSSLLYSREFCELARDHLTTGGILQHWVPNAEPAIVKAIGRTLSETFTDVLYYRAKGGHMFLASMRPIKKKSPQEMISTMPQAARDDLMEFRVVQGIQGDQIEYVSYILSKEKPLMSLNGTVKSPTITDDHPFNEYYILRRSRPC